MKTEIEYHPLQPFLPREAKLLMLGSFPPPRARWSMDFYYPNVQNDMWRIVGLVFFGRRDYFLDGKAFDKEKIVDFCTRVGLALSDTARAVRRLNGDAADKFLEIVEPADIAAMLDKMPHCANIAVTGQKAADTISALTGAAQPKTGECSEFDFAGRRMRLWRMPSSSRAYPLAAERKAEIYAEMFRETGLL